MNEKSIEKKNLNNKDDQALTKQFIKQKGNAFGKSFHIIDSPQIIVKISQIRKLNALKEKSPYKSIEQILQSKQTKISHHYKTNEERNKYLNLSNEVKSILNKIDCCANLNLSDLMLYKEQIIGSFLATLVQQIKLQCKQKGNFLDFLWKEMFQLLQNVLKSLSQQNNILQKQNLKEMIDQHKKYQDFIQIKQKEYNKIQKQLSFTNQFNKSLIYNLRIKKKQIKKLYGQIKTCTDMLNQYKSYYLDLQSQHIELLMENKQISRQNAIYLLKRKHQIMADKKKTFKSKFTKKSNLKMLKQQLQNEKEDQKTKIQRQVRELFAKQFQEKKAENKQFPKLSNFLFQQALEQFNYYSLDFGTDQILNSHTKTTFAQVGTDMQGASFNLQQVQTQVQYIDKIINQMAKNRGDQTIQQEKVKAKIFTQSQTQVQQICLKKLELTIKKVIDQSFLFQKKSQKIRLMTFSSKKNLQKSLKKIPQKNSARNIKINSKNTLVEKSQTNIAENNSRTTLVSGMRSSIRKSRSSLHFQTELLAQLHQNKNSLKDSNKNIDFVDAFDQQQEINVNKFIGKKLKQKKKNTIFEKQSERSSVSMHTMRNNIQERISSRFKPKDFDQNKQLLNQKYQKQNEKFLQKNLKHNESIGQNPTKKKLKKHVLIKQPNFQHQNTQKQRQQVSPQKKQLMKIFEKSGKDIAIDQNAHKSALKKIKEQIEQQNPDLLLDQNMNDYLKSKKFQHQEAFFKKMNEWIKPLVQDIKILVQNIPEIRKKLHPRRYKNLCKILSLVFSKAYQMIQRGQKIYNLINPLFQYFQIGYGIMKKYHLYSRMINFLSQAFCYKQQYHILYSFYFFLGIQRQNALSQKISSSDVHLYLKLLKSLAFGFTLPLNILNIYTSNVVLFKNTKETLLQEKIHQNIVQKVLNRVHQKLEKLTGVDLRPEKAQKYQKKYIKKTQQRESQAFQQIKLDVFKCTQLVLQQIINVKILIQQSYSQLVQFIFNDKLKDRVDESLIKFIIKCQFCTKAQQFKFYEVLKNMFYLSSLYYQYKKPDAKSQRSIKTLKTIRTFNQLQFQTKAYIQNVETQTLSLSDMCNFFLKINILDFNKTFYNSLYKFKIREEIIYNIALQNKSKMKKIFQFNKKYSLENAFLEKVQNNLENSTSVKHIFNKKLLILLNLIVVQDQTEKLVNKIIGKQLSFFNHKITLLIN